MTEQQEKEIEAKLSEDASNHVKDEHAKDYLDKYTEQLLRQTDNMLNSLKQIIFDNWQVQKIGNKQIEETNPFDEFIKMLEYYIHQVKVKYVKYQKDVGLKVKKENKEILEEVTKEDEKIDRSKPAKLVYIEQVRKLSME